MKGHNLLITELDLVFLYISLREIYTIMSFMYNDNKR